MQQQQAPQTPSINLEPAEPKDTLIYPFLKVIKEKEAVVQGLNPTNTYQHTLLKRIREISTPQAATKGTLFQITPSTLEPMKINIENAISSLNRLILNQLIVQVVCFDYDLENKKLATVSFFITNPPEITRKSIVDIYEELLRYSFNSIRLWFESRDDMEPKVFKEDLLQYISAKKNGSNTKGLNSIFNPLKEIRNLKYNVIVNEELIYHTVQEMTDRMLKEHMAVQLQGHGLLVLRDREVLPHHEAATEVLNDEIIPPLKVDPILKYKLDRITLEERNYFTLERFPLPTSKFVVKKAREIRQSKASTDPNSDYPGSLPVEIIINLETLVEKKYQEIWKEECNRSKKEFKTTLTDPSGNWSKLIRFVNQEESLTYHPDVWRDLVLDKDLFYILWQHHSSAFHIFTSREEAMLNTIMHGVLQLPPREHWKATAIKTLIEEKQLQLKSLFKDREFVSSFHKLLRKVYIDYLPWYKRILTIFPYFEGYFFTDAKKKIEEEQSALDNKNKEKFIEYLERTDRERAEKMVRLKDSLFIDSLIETLDVFYFTKLLVPTVKDVKDFYPDLDIKGFIQVLNDNKFKIIMPDDKTQLETGILLYTEENGIWKDRKSKVKKSMTKLLDGYANSYKYTPDKSAIDRIKKLLAFIDKK